MTIQNRVDNLQTKYRRMAKDNMYSEEYLQSALKQDFEKLQQEIVQEYKEELESANEKLEEIENENNKIVPKSDGIDEVLRRQELELRLSLMNDEDFEKYAEEILMNDHEYFDELRLFTGLKERGLEAARDAITYKRAQRLEENGEYQKLRTLSNTLDTFLGFGSMGEIAYEDDNGKVVYLDYQRVENESIKQ